MHDIVSRLGQSGKAFKIQGGIPPMNAHPILLQKKYARVVERFAERAGIPLDEALCFFYHSAT